jgi:hypothetical protein
MSNWDNQQKALGSPRSEQSLSKRAAAARMRAVGAALSYHFNRGNNRGIVLGEI